MKNLGENRGFVRLLRSVIWRSNYWDAYRRVRAELSWGAGGGGGLVIGSEAPQSLPRALQRWPVQPESWQPPLSIAELMPHSVVSAFYSIFVCQ